MKSKAFQDFYPDEYSHCFGCGRLNEFGLQLRSYWDGDESVARYKPSPEHIAYPGFVYGGLIAALIDCHSIGTAAMAVNRKEGRNVDDAHLALFVTGSLHVDFLKPAPLGPPLEIRGSVKEIHARKAIVETRVLVDGQVCARGEVVAVRIPEQMKTPTDKTD